MSLEESANRSSKSGLSKKDSAELLLGNCQVGRQLRPQTPLQLLAQLRHFHAGHHDKFAAQHLARLVVVRQLTRYAAILAFLVPAEASIRNRFRADELEAAQKRIALRHLKLLPQDDNFHQLLVRTERFRHDRALFFRAPVVAVKAAFSCTSAPQDLAQSE